MTKFGVILRGDCAEHAGLYGAVYVITVHQLGIDIWMWR